MKQTTATGQQQLRIKKKKNKQRKYNQACAESINGAHGALEFQLLCIYGVFAYSMIYINYWTESQFSFCMWHFSYCWMMHMQVHGISLQISCSLSLSLVRCISLTSASGHIGSCSWRLNILCVVDSSLLRSLSPTVETIELP